MKASYWQRGEALDYTNNTDKKIEAGSVLIMGKRIGVSGTDIEPGQTGSVHVSGVYEFDKKDKVELSVGTEVFFSEEGITDTAPAASADNAEKSSETEAVVSAPAGFVAVTSSADSAKVYVKINS